MNRSIIAASLLLIAFAGSGCCHLWENIHYWEDCLCCECGGACDVQGCGWGWGDYSGGHGCSGCGQDTCSGCGGCYYGEWHDGGGCDPCDCAGNWVGPGGFQGGHATYGSPYAAAPRGAVPGSVVVKEGPAHTHAQQERSVIVAEQPQHDHTPKRLR